MNAMERNKMRMSDVHFETSAYVAAHGHGPRGYGSWAFGTKRYTPVDSTEMFWAHGCTYREAKRQAAAFYAMHDVTVVWVQS